MNRVALSFISLTLIIPVCFGESHLPAKGPRPQTAAEKKPEATTVALDHVEPRTKSEESVSKKLGALAGDQDFMDGKKVVVVSTVGCIHCEVIKKDVLKSFMAKGLSEADAKKRIIEVDMSKDEDKQKYMPLLGHLMLAGGYNKYSYPTTFYVTTDDEGKQTVRFFPGNYTYVNPAEGFKGEPDFISKSAKK